MYTGLLFFLEALIIVGAVIAMWPAKDSRPTSYSLAVGLVVIFVLSIISFYTKTTGGGFLDNDSMLPNHSLATALTYVFTRAPMLLSFLITQSVNSSLWHFMGFLVAQAILALSLTIGDKLGPAREPSRKTPKTTR